MYVQNVVRNANINNKCILTIRCLPQSRPIQKSYSIVSRDGLDPEIPIGCTIVNILKKKKKERPYKKIYNLFTSMMIKRQDPRDHQKSSRNH